MDKKTKKATGIKATKTFKPDNHEGSVELVFSLDGTKYAGKSLVAFEKLYTSVTPDGTNTPKETQVAHHEDLNDTDQTVSIVKISTKLYNKADKKKTASIGNKVKLVDEVSYQGLTPGKTYVLKGKLMNKKTGKTTKITAKKKFKAKKANGKVKLTFTVDTTQYYGESLVAFERLYNADGVKIAVHEDIKDKAQTVKVPNPSKPAPASVAATGTSGTAGSAKTGDTNMPGVYGVVALGALAAIILEMKRRRRKE